VSPGPTVMLIRIHSLQIQLNGHRKTISQLRQGNILTPNDFIRIWLLAYEADSIKVRFLFILIVV